MIQSPENLVFEGGGVLGIAYLGALHYLYQHRLLSKLKRVAGTSAGAITACIVSFDLPFDEIKKIADTLDYRKIPQTGSGSVFKKISEPLQKELGPLFGDTDCIYRLITKYGWFSTDYFYDWIKEQIAAQFDPAKKKPPYTFADFQNPLLHKHQKPFHDLYIIGTDLSYHTSRIFSYETTPDMEVATAVKISMSIPLFFESADVKMINTDNPRRFFCDGGVMWNYPLNIFDSSDFNTERFGTINPRTLGLRFLTRPKYHSIHNFIDYIYHLYQSLLSIQQNLFDNSPQDKARSIQIDTKDVSYIDFNISADDNTYRFLYKQGYHAVHTYIESHPFAYLD